MDGILVDHEVYEHTKHLYQFEKLAPVKAKGYDNPVKVFRPLDSVQGSLTMAAWGQVCQNLSNPFHNRTNSTR